MSAIQVYGSLCCCIGLASIIVASEVSDDSVAALMGVMLLLPAVYVALNWPAAPGVALMLPSLTFGAVALCLLPALGFSAPIGLVLPCLAPGVFLSGLIRQAAAST